MLPAGLSFAPDRAVVPPRDAATVIVVRQLEGERDGGIEVYCVQRHTRSGFLGGAVVFPGGKVDAADADEAFLQLARGLPSRPLEIARTEVEARSLAVAAARETLEEAGLAPVAGIDRASLSEMRRELASGAAFAAVCAQAAEGRPGFGVDLGAFVPFGRWITPVAEARRFDARFYLLALPQGQIAEHDGHETTVGFWARPEQVLARFMAGEIQLAPPTTRTLELLRGVRSFEEAVEIAARQSLLPVCPQFVPGDPPALALPGDPAHEIAERRVDGPSRFVLRDGRFVSEDYLPSR